MRKLAVVLSTAAIALVSLAGPAAASCGSLSCIGKTSGSAAIDCHTPFGTLSDQRCAPKLG